MEISRSRSVNTSTLKWITFELLKTFKNLLKTLFLLLQLHEVNDPFPKFKKCPLEFIKFQEQPLLCIHDPSGVKLLIRLRLDFSY